MSVKNRFDCQHLLEENERTTHLKTLRNFRQITEMNTFNSCRTLWIFRSRAVNNSAFCQLFNFTRKIGRILGVFFSSTEQNYKRDRSDSTGLENWELTSYYWERLLLFLQRAQAAAAVGSSKTESTGPARPDSAFNGKCRCCSPAWWFSDIFRVNVGRNFSGSAQDFLPLWF